MLRQTPKTSASRSSVSSGTRNHLNSGFMSPNEIVRITQHAIEKGERIQSLLPLNKNVGVLLT